METILMKIDSMKINLRDYDLMKLSSASSISIFILCEKMTNKRRPKRKDQEEMNILSMK